MQAYILIQTEAGQAADVAQRVRGLSENFRAQDVIGPYDVIAHVAAGSLDDLSRDVISQVQAIEGVTRTLTCTIVAH